MTYEVYLNDEVVAAGETHDDAVRDLRSIWPILLCNRARREPRSLILRMMNEQHAVITDWRLRDHVPDCDLCKTPAVISKRREIFDPMNGAFTLRLCAYCYWSKTDVEIVDAVEADLEEHDAVATDDDRSYGPRGRHEDTEND